VFYRQSDVPEILELTWLLTCVTSKGLMNRSHAYKAAVAENEETAGNDPDTGITMGLFSYPILMAADILLFNAHKIPVGKDQLQHIEMARDIGARFNHIYGEHFTLPEAVIDENGAILQGLDGRKMSKSYNNTIPLFEPEKKLKKLINKIKTNSLEPHEPKDTSDCTLFSMYQAFANADEVAEVAKRYQEGIGWGEMKAILFEKVNAEVAPARERYEELLLQPDLIEEKLQIGAAKARAISQPFISQLREAVGISRFGGK
jgi:tryptophanyl-tRNA synthetase